MSEDADRFERELERWREHYHATPERDADFHVPARDLPSGYTALYCRRCIGEFMITEAVFSRGSEI